MGVCCRLVLAGRWALSGTATPHVVELAGLNRKTHEVGARWAYLHALVGPLLLILVGVVLSYWMHTYTLVDSLYWTTVTMTPPAIR